jgi:hypothetical protein
MLNLLHFYISTFRSVCAVRNMAVFCSSLILCFAVTLLMYFLNDFEMIQVVPIITGITFVVTFHMCCISKARSLYDLKTSKFFLDHISVSRNCNIHLLFSLSRIMMSGLLRFSHYYHYHHHHHYRCSTCVTHPSAASEMMPRGRASFISNHLFVDQLNTRQISPNILTTKTFY